MRAKKVDANQTAIVRVLRTCPGISVDVGHDDILVGFRGKTYWFEIKNQAEISRKTGMVKESAKKESQKKLDALWTGHRAYVSTVEQILSIITEDVF